MDNKLLFSLLILLIINIQYTTCAVTDPTPLDFIKTACETTPYPDLCVNSLSSYASSIQGNYGLQLAKAAIEVSLNTAKSLAAHVSELAETSNLNLIDSGALIYCFNSNISPLYVLGWSAQEYEKLKQLEFPDYVSLTNIIQNQVTSALAFQTQCFSGIADRITIRPFKDPINEEMGSLSKVISITVALMRGAMGI